MADIKVIIGADIQELDQKLAQAKAKLTSIGQEGPRSIQPLQDRLKGLTFPTEAVSKFGGTIKEMGSSFLKSHGSTLLFGAAIAAAGVAIAGISYVAKIIAKDFITVSNSAEIAGKKIKEYNDIVKSATESVAKESTEIIGLLSVLNNETETRERKLSVIKELQQIQPEIFKGLKLEGEAVVGLDDAYKSYLINLRSVIAAKIIQAQIEASITELLKIQGAENTKQEQAQLDFLKNAIALNPVLAETKKALQDSKLAGGFLTDKQSANRVAELTEKIKGLFEKLTEFSNTVKVNEFKIKVKKVKVEPDDIELLPPRSGILPQSEDKTINRASGSTLTPTIEIKPEFKVDEDAQRRAFETMKEWLKRIDLEAFQKDATDAINETISNIVNDTISNVADAVGEALSGGKDVVPRLFDNIIKGIGQQIKELGKYLVKIGLEKLAIDKAIDALKINPAATIAVGFAAQVLGSLLISAAQKKSSSLGSGFASGTTGVQNGGIFNVGERGPERIFLPSGAKVQPNNELNAFSGSGVVLQPSIYYEGTGFRIMLNRVDAQMGRNG